MIYSSEEIDGTPGHATALISEIALVWMGHFLLDRTDKSSRVSQRDLDGEGDSKEHEEMRLSGSHCFFWKPSFCIEPIVIVICKFLDLNCSKTGIPSQ